MQAVVSISNPGPENTAPEGHDAAMVKRYEDGQAAAARGEAYKAPEGAPAVDPSKAPADGAPAAATPPADGAKAPASDAPQVPAEGAQKGDFVDNLLTSAGLTRDKIAEEFLDGGLKPGTYEALAAQGVNREAVDHYMAGLSAQMAQARTAYEESVLSTAQVDRTAYGQIVEWASASLTPGEIDAFNGTVNGGDAAKAALAVAGLKARYAAANPAEPTLMTQGVTQGGGAAAYQSWAQVKSDMQKPEYSKDPAFREQVKARLAVSKTLA